MAVLKRLGRWLTKVRTFGTFDSGYAKMRRWGHEELMDHFKKTHDWRVLRVFMDTNREQLALATLNAAFKEMRRAGVNDLQQVEAAIARLYDGKPL